MTAKKIARYATAAAMGLAPISAYADDGAIPGEFSANIGIFSDYQFRGTSQTGEDPAIQGGIDYSLNTGIQDTSVYVGVWGSNVDFNDGDEAQVELDVYGGFAGTIEGVDWQLGALGYLYPGASSSLNYDYVEVAASLGYTFYDLVTVGIGYNYSPDYFAASGDGHYLQGTVSVAVPLPESIKNAGFGLSIDGLVGHQWVEDNATFGAPDYLTWSIGASVSYEMLTLGISYVDTDLSDADCFGGTELCEARAIAFLKASF